jgi:Tol biopolymer transport system component
VLPPPFVAPQEDVSPGVDIDPAWSPTGDFIVYRTWPTTGGQVMGFYRVFVDPEGQRVGDPELLLDLTDLGPAGEQRISPDGTKYAFWLWGDIWVQEIATKDTMRVTRVGDARWPDWHPDGEWLVYMQVLGGSPIAPDSSGGMHVVNVNTLEDRQLTRRGGLIIAGGHPRWDREGKSIILAKGAHGSEVFRVFPDSTDYIQLARTGWNNEWPHWWYLHGEEVVFTSIDPERRRMEYVINLDDGSIRCFSSGTRLENLRLFDFSPDQTKLVTTRRDTTGTIGVLWVLDIPTGRWTQLTAPPL